MPADELDLREIARTEDWCGGFCWPSVDGFGTGDSGLLILMDGCGHYVYVPMDRFTLEWTVLGNGKKAAKRNHV